MSGYETGCCFSLTHNVWCYKIGLRWLWKQIRCYGYSSWDMLLLSKRVVKKFKKIKVMKNIFVLPTDKPSRLIYNDANQLCYHSNKSYKNDRKWMHRKKFNIYITSDEEIREWYIYEGRLLRASVNHSKYELLYGKPIILTTDPDLIKDGVQAIEDEFLEWFVKNPSCEFVEVFHQLHKDEPLYKIIIPQEEPNKLNLKELENKLDDSLANETKESLTSWLSSKRNEQETLEEAAEKYKYNPKGDFCFTKGAKWQSERMYSEEDLREAFRQGQDNVEYSEMYGFDSKLTEQDWFSQFKKK
jgi:hypothetical protein